MPSQDVTDELYKSEIAQEVITRENASERKILDAQWAGLLDTKSGRLLVWDLLRDHGVFQRAAGLTDAGLREYVGKREVGLDIFDKIFEVNPNAFVLMMRENDQRRQALDNVIRRAIAEQTGV